MLNNPIIGVFFVLHGLVHLLYLGQSLRLFALQPGLIWPDGSWAFARLLGDNAIRWLAFLASAMAAVGFVVSGIDFFFEPATWRTIVAGSAIFSSVLYILFWNGRLQRLDQQGAIGVLINLAILALLAYNP